MSEDIPTVTIDFENESLFMDGVEQDISHTTFDDAVQFVAESEDAGNVNVEFANGGD